MDRLEAQHINPYTVPGLLPGLLGLVMILLGVLLGLAQLGPRRRAWSAGRSSRSSGDSMRRLALVLGLILVYTVALLGRGLPFWLGSALYVDRLDRAAAGAAARRRRTRADAGATSRSPLAIGLGVGRAIITASSRTLFLVRLP